MTHAYDFYKPDMKSEYPFVDGHLSISCYMCALDGCYADLLKNSTRIASSADRYPEAAAILARKRQGLIDIFDFMAFHTPNCKLVSKSYGRILYNDFRNDESSTEFASSPFEICHTKNRSNPKS